MMLESIQEYSADATRFALADSGDSMEDANFDRAVANNSISYLFTEEAYVKEVVAEAAEGKLRSGEMTFMDEAFNNELDYLIEATFIEFEGMRYRDGIHRCWYDLLIARDLYRDWGTKCGVALHKSYGALCARSSCDDDTNHSTLERGALGCGQTSRRRRCKGEFCV